MRLIDIDPINKDLTLKKRVLTAKYGEYAAEDGSYMSWREIFELVNRQPEVDAVPVKHGNWETIGGGFFVKGEYHAVRFKCSICGHFVNLGTDRNYCPHCGAKMDGERKDDEVD